MTKSKLKLLTALCALAVFAPDFSQAAGGEPILVEHTISPEPPERRDYSWLNATEPDKTLFPNYTFTFDITVETTEKYKLAPGYPIVSPNDEAGVVWSNVGTVCKITNATSSPKTVTIKVEALWVLKDPMGGGSGSGSGPEGGGGIKGSATATVRLANSDVVWEIPEPIVLTRQ